MAGPSGGDQPDPSAVPTILIGIIGTLVTILIVLFCQVLFRVTERNRTVEAGKNQELLAYEVDENQRLTDPTQCDMPIDAAMESVLQEYSR